MWMLNDDKTIMSNVNQAKFVQLDGKIIHIYFDKENIFSTEFDTEQEAKQKFAKFAEFWAAQTWEEFMERF